MRRKSNNLFKMRGVYISLIFGGLLGGIVSSIYYFNTVNTFDLIEFILFIGISVFSVAGIAALFHNLVRRKNRKKGGKRK